MRAQSFGFWAMTMLLAGTAAADFHLADKAPGSVCMKVSTSAADRAFSSAGLGGVATKNIDFVSNVVTCPVDTAPVETEYATVMISTGAASCGMQVRSENGASFGVFANDRISVAGNNRWKYEFCVGAGNCNTVGYQVAIECTVPVGAIIEGTTWDAQD